MNKPMTRRHKTFSELRWSEDPSDADLPIRWANSVATRVLDWTWRAFDSLLANHIVHADLTRPVEQLERDLTRNHFLEIQILFGNETEGFPSYAPHHEWPEMESRTAASAKPPAYDLAFISLENRRWAWPIEAKVVRSPDGLGDYLKDVNDKFVGGVAAPMVGEGAMIAYLLTSDTEKVFQNLARRLKQTLEPVPKFQERPHRLSHHPRIIAPNLSLHHLLMKCIDELEDAEPLRPGAR